MVSASWVRRKSSNRSACEPRAPRWTSEINKVRKRRSGLSSLIESLPIGEPIIQFRDNAMTSCAANGTLYKGRPACRDRTARTSDVPQAGGPSTTDTSDRIGRVFAQAAITVLYDNQATATAELTIWSAFEQKPARHLDGRLGHRSPREQAPKGW